jgi:hypothetical protein
LATRGRPRKNPINPTTETSSKTTNKPKEKVTEEVSEDYFRKYAATLQSAMNSSYLFNPLWTNEILKDINMTPRKYDRDTVKNLLANPKSNEKALKDLSQYLFNSIMQYKRLVIYMSEMLTFDWHVEPTNADEEDMAKANFKSSYKKVVQFMNDLDPKMIFPDVAQSMLLEDGKFYYLRSSENGYYFQEMPSDYCKIWAKTELGYQYAFNLTYFLRAGVNFDDFAPEFKEYFDNFINGDEYKDNKSKFKENRWYYWQTLNSSSAWTFKFDNLHAGMSPPFMSLFIDAIEITTYKDLLKSKTALDIYKLLIAKIPIDTNNNKTGRKDNFAVSSEQAAKFQSIMQSAIQQGIKIVASPLEVEAIDLNKSENKDSIIGLGNQEFWDTSGTSSALFSGVKMNASTMQASLRTDETFVTHLYRQVIRFYNFKLKEVSGKYRWKIHMEGTIHDKQDRIDRAMTLIPFGSPLTYVIVAQGRTQQEFVNVLNLETISGMRDKMKPLISAHTVSNKKGGRPEQANVSDAGEITQDAGSNIEKQA